MEKFFKAYWKQLAVVVVFIITLIAVYLYAKKQGANTVAPAIPGDNPNNPLTDAERAKAKSISDRIRADIMDWDGGAFRDWDSYNELATASDRVFFAVINLYQSEYGITLKQDMQDESYWIDQVPLIGGTDIIQLIYNRMM